MNDLAIEMQAVYKSFRSTDVLRGVTLNVARGRTFAFLGRNASGKTTTIRMLLGLLKRDDGAIRVLGFDPQREPIELRRHVGYLAEDQTMYGWMRVEEIVRFVAPFYPTLGPRIGIQISCAISNCRCARGSSTCRRARTCGSVWCWRLPIGRKLSSWMIRRWGSIPSCGSNSIAISSRICKAKGVRCSIVRTGVVSQFGRA